MSKKTLDEVYEKHYRDIVDEAGGIWVGIQECDVDHRLDCVLFNIKQHGSTLAVKLDGCTVAKVQKRIEDSIRQMKG